MSKKLEILVLMLAVGLGFAAVQADASDDETLADQVVINPETDAGSDRPIDFTFEIIEPEKTTPVDGCTPFFYRLTNVSKGRITPRNVLAAVITYVPGLPLEYIDGDWFNIKFKRMRLRPGESMMGLFYCFNWSDKVPIGYVQGGYMTLQMLSGEDIITRSVRYQVTIVPRH